MTATSGTRSSSYDSGDKKDDWGSSSGTVSSPWANDSNAAARGGRSTPRSSAPFRDSQPVVDDWGISSNPSTVPIIKTVCHTTTGNSGADDWDAAADAWSAIDTTKSTSLSGNSNAEKGGGDCDAVAGISDDCPSSSSARDSRIISRNRPCATLKIVDWGILAEVGKSVSVSNDKATPHIPQMEDSNVSGLGGGGKLRSFLKI